LRVRSGHESHDLSHHRHVGLTPQRLPILLGCYLRRQRGRLGAPKAITATAHNLARIIYHLVQFGGEYIKLTEAAYTEQIRNRLEKSLHKRAKELGYKLTKVETPPEELENPLGM
jgi:hypothetical protein